MAKEKLDSLIFLRAIAVIAVCFCHFGHPLESHNTIGQVLNIFHRYGKYGVHIFFVVSGFVIPLSLQTSKYSFNNYLRFLWKRILRLHPPYIIALLLTLLLSYYSYKTRNVAYPETFTSILKSLFYYHVPADNPVFWTLAIEAQYYIFIGIVYILIISYPKTSVLIGIPVVIVASHLKVSEYISFLYYIPYFAIGILIYLTYCEVGIKTLNFIALTILLFYTFIFHENSGAIAALFATIVIFLYHNTIPISIKFIGEVSYSLYLIHFPLGLKFINLAKRHIDPTYNLLIFFFAITLVVIASWVFYRFIEKTFANLSSKIKYTNTTSILNYE